MEVKEFFYMNFHLERWFGSGILGELMPEREH